MSWEDVFTSLFRQRPVDKMSSLGKITRLLEEAGHKDVFHDSMALNAHVFLDTGMQHSGKLSGSLAHPQLTADLSSDSKVLASCGPCLQIPKDGDPISLRPCLRSASPSWEGILPTCL